MSNAIGTQRIAGLQSLRALAAVMVLIGHVLAEAEHYFALSLPGDAIPWTRGVDVFFVISGFVITISAKRFKNRPFAFFKRRLLRVVPLYFFFTTLMVAVLLVLPGTAKDTSLDFGQILSSYGFVPYARDDGRIAPVLSLGWTLNYEVFFYAIFALCLVLRRPLTALVVLLSALSQSGWLYPGTATAYVFWTNPIILEFLFGVGLAQIYDRVGRVPSASLALAVFAAGLGLLVFLDATSLPRFVAAGLPATLMVASGTVFCPRQITPGQMLGDASFALYLSHRFALRAATLILLPLLPNTQFGAWLFVSIACGMALVVGLVVHRFLERPMMRAMTMNPRTVVA